MLNSRYLWQSCWHCAKADFKPLASHMNSSCVGIIWKTFTLAGRQHSFVIGRDISKVCGKSVVKNFFNSSNNQTTLPEEYMPWSVEVKGYCQGKNFGYQRVICQGFLVITDKENAQADVILTTASCLFKETNCVRFHVFNPVNNKTVNVAFFTTMAKSFKGMNHDIALLFLQSPIQFSRRTWPICFSSMINSIADSINDCVFIRRVEDGEAVICRKDRRWFLKSIGGTSLSADKDMVKVFSNIDHVEKEMMDSDLHNRIEILADEKNSTIRMHGAISLPNFYILIFSVLELGAYRILLLCFLERNCFNDFSSLIFYHLGRLLRISHLCSAFKPDLSSEMHHVDSMLEGYSKELENELPEERNMTDNIFVSDKCRNALLHQAEYLRDCLYNDMKQNNHLSDEMQLDEKNAHLLSFISGIRSSFQKLYNEKNGITASVSDVTANTDSVASSNGLRKSGGKRKTAQHAEGETSCLARKRAKILNLKQPVKNKRAADNLDHHQNASDNAKSLQTTKFAKITRNQNRKIEQSVQKSSSKRSSCTGDEKEKTTVSSEVLKKDVTLVKKKKCWRQRGVKKKAVKSKSSDEKAIPTTVKPTSLVTVDVNVGKSDSAVTPFEDIFDNNVVAENESQANECNASPALLPSHTDEALQNEVPENLAQLPVQCSVDSSANSEVSQPSEHFERIIQKDVNSILLSTESPQKTDSSETVLESTAVAFEMTLENGSVSKESEKLHIENEQASIPQTLPSIDSQSEPAASQHDTSVVECLTSDPAFSSMINVSNSEPVATVQSFVGSSGSSSCSNVEIIDLCSYSESASASDSEKDIVIDLTVDDEEDECRSTLPTDAFNETSKVMSKINTDENGPKAVEETLLPLPKAAAIYDRNEFALTENDNSSDVNGDLRAEVNISDKKQKALVISLGAVLVEKAQESAEEVTAHARSGVNGSDVNGSGNQPRIFRKGALLRTALPRIGSDGKPMKIRSYRLLTSKPSVECDKLRKVAECSATNIHRNVVINKKSSVLESNGKLLLNVQKSQVDGEKKSCKENGLRPSAMIRELNQDQTKLSQLMAKFNRVENGNIKNNALNASDNSLPSTSAANSTNNGGFESSKATSTIHNGTVDKQTKKVANTVHVLSYVIDDEGKKHYRLQLRPSSTQVVPNEASTSAAAAVTDAPKHSDGTLITLR
ncbi:hypothetical protein T4D_6911 [Trichinella pseudospiralis]|uniref:Peptidase S1 domain-containing protein n=1 Tax=Trichinella pseudospiralis TaxID=6337 RepID=A0A0V1FUM0_TRIPS|nr:hypothetical protein T4D_6911 [Trichinella pseudospiralis]